VLSFLGFSVALASQRLLATRSRETTPSRRTRARSVELERSLATERARFEWLSVHVNELKTERAILLDRVLEVQVPVMQIARDPVDSSPRRPRRGAADSPADLRDRRRLRAAAGRRRRPGAAPSGRRSRST
jgi:hypothetical protein